MDNKYVIIFRRIAIACFVIPLLIGLIGGLLVDKIPIDMISLGMINGFFLFQFFLLLVAPFFILLTKVAGNMEKAKQSQTSIPLAKTWGFVFSGTTMIILIIMLATFFAKEICKPKPFGGGVPILFPFLYTGLPGIVGYWAGWAVGIFYLFFIRRNVASASVKLYQVFISIVVLAAVAFTVNYFYQNHALCRKAESASTSPTELWKIFYGRQKKTGPDLSIFFCLAENKKCPPEILVSLSEIPQTNEHLAERILDNPNMSVEVLRNLSRQEDVEIRRMVAGHPLAPSDILNNLKNDSDTVVKYNVMKNPNVPKETSKALFNDVEVRRTLAWDRHTPSSVLDNLKNDSDMHVRYYVARNPNTSPETLHFLLNDKDSLVKGWADYQLKNRNNVVQEK